MIGETIVVGISNTAEINDNKDATRNAFSVLYNLREVNDTKNINAIRNPPNQLPVTEFAYVKDESMSVGAVMLCNISII